MCQCDGAEMCQASVDDGNEKDEMSEARRGERGEKSDRNREIQTTRHNTAETIK